MWPLPHAYFPSMYHFLGLCSLRSPPAHSLQFGSKLLYFSSALYILSYSLLCDILPIFQSGLSCHSGVICLMTVQSEPRRPHSLLVYVKWVRCPLELNNYCCLQLCPFWLSVSCVWPLWIWGAGRRRIHRPLLHFYLFSSSSIFMLFKAIFVKDCHILEN